MLLVMASKARGFLSMRLNKDRQNKKINNRVFKNRTVGHKAESYFKRNAINKPCKAKQHKRKDSFK